MSNIQQRIAQIIRQVDGDHTMGAAALAEALVSELGLTRVEGVSYGVRDVFEVPRPDDYGPRWSKFSRYVTEWVPAMEDE
jgi:hypothetical protein